MLYLHCGPQGCPLGGHPRHGRRDLLHSVLPAGKAESPDSLEKLNMMGNRSSDKGCSQQRPSVVLEPHFIKQGNVLSACTGVGVKVVPGPGQFPEGMI